MFAVGTMFARDLVDAHGVKATSLATVLVAVVLADVGTSASFFAIALCTIVFAKHRAAAVSALVLDAPVRADARAPTIATLLLAPTVFAVRCATAFPIQR